MVYIEDHGADNRRWIIPVTLPWIHMYDRYSYWRIFWNKGMASDLFDTCIDLWNERRWGSDSVYKVPIMTTIINLEQWKPTHLVHIWLCVCVVGWLYEWKKEFSTKRPKKGTYSLHDNDFCLSGDASLDRENWIAIPRLCYLLSHKCIILSLSPIMGLGIYRVYMALQTDMCMNALVHLLSRCTSKICAWKTRLRSISRS